MSIKNPVIIGKNVIETLTLGMYEDSRFIYREYVQNAADQIDIAVEQSILSEKNEGKILITINDDERKIIIEDNATGIKSQNALQFLGDVARSEKDADERKGFRGIGRLGGLGYCEKLIFETSFKGETIKTTVNLDAKLLKRTLLDKTNNIDAASVISLITSVISGKEDETSHYFRVILEGVTNEELLDQDQVIEYLSMVAPLPFHKDFEFGKEIHEHFNNNNQVIEEYNVVNIEVNRKKLYKAYTKTIIDKNYDPISEIISVDFFNLKNNKNELLAIGWYGISNKINTKLTQNNTSRGLRIKKNNITIGNEYTVSKFFNEARYNHHYVGEIHVFGSDFRPNARRDYFNDSNTVTSFENELKKQCKFLTKLAQTCSNIGNRLKEIKNYKQIETQFEENLEKQIFVTREDEDDAKKEVQKAKKTAESASQVLIKIKEKSEIPSAVETLFEDIVGDFDILIGDQSESKAKPTEKYPVDELNKLSDSERELVLEIFQVIKDNLPRSQVSKIQREIIEKVIKTFKVH